MKKLLVFILCLTSLLPSAALAAELNLSMAASLKEAVNEISTSFKRMNPGVRINSNAGASGTLAKQIENGAPADLFLSANQEWMNHLQAKGVVAQNQTMTFAHNELVFAGRTPLKINRMQDLPQLERIAIGSPKSVPAGGYALEAMQKTGVDKLMGKKLIMARDARECLMYAERGEVDGAFIYRSDALLAVNAKTLFTIPRELYGRVTYLAGLTTTGAKKPEAAALFRFLQTAEARRILEKHGFAAH